MAEKPSLGHSLLNYAKAPSEAGSTHAQSNGNDRLESVLNALTSGKPIASAPQPPPAPASPHLHALRNAEGRGSPVPRRVETPTRLAARQSLAAAARIPMGPQQPREERGAGLSTPRVTGSSSPRSVRSVDVRPAGIWSPSVLSESEFNPPSTVDTNRFRHLGADTKRRNAEQRMDVFAGIGKDTSRIWKRRDSRPLAFNITQEGKLAVNGFIPSSAPVESKGVSRIAVERGSPEPIASKLAMRDRERERERERERDRERERERDDQPKLGGYAGSLFSEDDDDYDEELEEARLSGPRIPLVPLARPVPPARRQTVLDLVNDDLDSLLDEDDVMKDDYEEHKSEPEDQPTPKAMRNISTSKLVAKPIHQHQHQHQNHHQPSHLQHQHEYIPQHHAPQPIALGFTSLLSKMARTTTEENYRKRRRPSYDYDDKTLESMPYSELKNQPFDYDPAVAPALQATKGHGETLPAQLQHYKSRTDADQRDFFTRMTVTDWERSGDWFLDQFGDMVMRIIQARKERRAMVEKFEDEISKREAMVRATGDAVERKLGKMKLNGLKLVADET